MAYGDAEHIKGILENRRLEKLRINSPVKIEPLKWVDVGGNREVFNQLRNKKFNNVADAERFILEVYGSGSRPILNIKSLIDGKVLRWQKNLKKGKKLKRIQ